MPSSVPDPGPPILSLSGASGSYEPGRSALPGGPSTRNKVRTAPLWGLHARTRFMHDFLSHSLEDAIQRHGNQAESSRRAFNALSRGNQRRLLTFLRFRIAGNH